MDGTPDQLLDEDDQHWAISKLQEYIYRTHFHLSKQDMESEPMEDIMINMRLMNLTAMRDRREQKLMQSKSRVK